MKVKYKYNPVSLVCHAIITGALLMNANTIAFADDADDKDKNDD